MHINAIHTDVDRRKHTCTDTRAQSVCPICVSGAGRGLWESINKNCQYPAGNHCVCLSLSLSLRIFAPSCTSYHLKKKKKMRQGPGVSHQTCQVHIAAIKKIRRQFMTLNLKLGCFLTISPKARGVGDGHFSYCCPRMRRVDQVRHLADEALRYRRHVTDAIVVTIRFPELSCLITVARKCECRHCPF